MVTLLLIKWLATASVVIGVSLAAVRLGPGIGGVLAGTPIVLGPGYFFMLREQPGGLVADAALGSLHAMLATLAFCLAFVLASGRFGAWASAGISAGLWWVAAAVANALPGGVGLALVVFLACLAMAMRRLRSLHLASVSVSAPVRWVDLLLRGSLAGAIVCLATLLVGTWAPAVSGMVLSFPIGMLTIALTLHQRYGAAAARATLASTQLGMLSLVAFSAVLALSADTLPPATTFSLAVAAALATSGALWARQVVGWRCARTSRKSG
ncbi:hypothetical protein ACSEE7_03740 [Halomonas cupida]|uniref:hypothetical protein n=1 Tax=Halomonas cupida TaxID=44933 RepID=UPI002EC048BE|nr:hypothetical protein [Pseudomonadota bacterium]